MSGFAGEITSPGDTDRIPRAAVAAWPGSSGHASPGGALPACHGLPAPGQLCAPASSLSRGLVRMWSLP